VRFLAAHDRMLKGIPLVGLFCRRTAGGKISRSGLDEIGPLVLHFHFELMILSVLRRREGQSVGHFRDDAESLLLRKNSPPVLSARRAMAASWLSRRSPSDLAS
jgi:hypothetical protein